MPAGRARATKATAGLYSKSLWPFHTNLAVDHVGAPPTLDELRSNGQRQHLDPSPGHDRAKFGGSSLPAGRARATKATAGLYSKSLWPFHTNLAVDHVGAPPTLDRVRSNGQRQHLDPSPGHARAKFGGSSLPAGRARATKATAGLYSKSLWPFHTNLAVDHVGAPPTLDRVRSNGQRQHLDPSPGHARAKFGGSSLPAGRARATKATAGLYSKSLWPFHTNLAVDHVGAPPTLDEVRSNGQRQHLDPSPGHARAKFGGSSLPAGRARATKATAGLYSKSLWSFHTNLAVDHVGAPPTLDRVRSNGQRQHLDPSPGHARAKFGGSSLPAGRARATKATAGLYSKSLWPFHTNLAVDHVGAPPTLDEVRSNGQRQHLDPSPGHARAKFGGSSLPAGRARATKATAGLYSKSLWSFHTNLAVDHVGAPPTLDRVRSNGQRQHLDLSPGHARAKFGGSSLPAGRARATKATAGLYSKSLWSFHTNLAVDHVGAPPTLDRVRSNGQRQHLDLSPGHARAKFGGSSLPAGRARATKATAGLYSKSLWPFHTNLAVDHVGAPPTLDRVRSNGQRQHLDPSPGHARAKFGGSSLPAGRARATKATAGLYSKSLWPFHTNLAVDHVGAPPTLDEVRSIGQRQHLDPSPGHARAKFGGSSLPGGRARATKATAGLYSKSLWPFHTNLAVDHVGAPPTLDRVRSNGQRQHLDPSPGHARAKFGGSSLPAGRARATKATAGLYSKSLWPFHTNLAVDHVGAPPTLDELRSNGQRQHLDPSPGHNRAKFGGSSLPAGRARATKATAGLYSKSLWPFHTNLAVDHVGAPPTLDRVRSNGQRQHLDPSPGHARAKFGGSSLPAGRARATKATAGLYSKSLWPFHTNLAVDHVGAPPTLDRVRSNGQRQHLDPFPGHARAKFGGSSLPAGRARATKATAGLYSKSLWPFHTNLAVDHVGAPPTLDEVRSNGQRQHLDPSPGHARAKFGGSSLPAGRARATKATAGLYSKSLWPFHTNLAVDHVGAPPTLDEVRSNGQWQHLDPSPGHARAKFGGSSLPAGRARATKATAGLYSKSLWPFHTNLAVDHVGAPPTLDEVRSNGQRQHLDPCPGHARAKFGGSSLPAGRARATKATAGLYSKSLWPFHTNLAVDHVGAPPTLDEVRSNGQWQHLDPSPGHARAKFGGSSLPAGRARATKATAGLYSKSLWPFHTNLAVDHVGAPPTLDRVRSNGQRQHLDPSPGHARAKFGGSSLPAGRARATKATAGLYSKSLWPFHTNLAVDHVGAPPTLDKVRSIGQRQHLDPSPGHARAKFGGSSLPGGRARATKATAGLYSKSLWPFHTNLAVDHVGAPPTLDRVRSNGQRQHLDPSPGHARAKFGGSSLPAGRARATKATAGLYSKSLWPFHTNLAVDHVGAPPTLDEVRSIGQRQHLDPSPGHARAKFGGSSLPGGRARATKATAGLYSKSLWPFHTNLAVDHVGAPPTLDRVRSNGQRQHLDPSPGHARAKFGGSSLPAGRARATKATAGLYSKSLWPFHTNLAVDHVGAPPTLDEVRSIGQRQHLDPSPGHARAKFGGSSLPGGRARATKATAGLYSKSLWPFHTNLAVDHVGAPRPLMGTIKRTTAAPRPIPWPCPCQVWWLQLACRPSQSDQGNCWSLQQVTLAISH